ncbi:hypothetical protein QUA20_29665 [Microcoleus sp. Pol7_A1]|uniref:hypothetical protein n=1 Tax=Microcoleus sp. Pol7_A1 TaxID=2818893 RepID=UPI002FD710AF
MLRYSIKNKSEIEIKTIGRPRTAAALKIAIELAEKREAAKMAQKLATPPKPYTPKESSAEVLVPKIGNDVKTYFKYPIRNSVYTRITASIDALGIKARNAKTVTGTSIVDFQGNHKKVWRVCVYKGLATPIAKLTPWGTRTIKMIDKSFQFPIGGKTRNAAITVFKTLFGDGGALRQMMGTTNDRDQLLLGKQVITSIQN